MARITHLAPINMESTIFNTDSYKVSHYLQYPKDTQGLFSYIESRGGAYPYSVMFGLQYFLNKYLQVPVTKEEVAVADDFLKSHMGYFNREGWDYIANLGYLPVKISAVSEGTKVPTGNILVSVESTDPKVAWIAGWIEAALLRAIWYPSTVATLSATLKEKMKPFWERTSSSPESDFNFKLHDFGARGSTSLESSALAGAAHLISWKGTDTISGLTMAHNYYASPMPGYSIGAAEHSTVTSWGRNNEVEAFRNMVNTFGGTGMPYAVISDSYNLWYAIEHLWGEVLREEVMKAEGLLVIRPDSGDPVEVVKRALHLLARKFGFSYNQKGFKVLRKVRLIQGDGVNEDSIIKILEMMEAEGFAFDNAAFGMGGGLHQLVNRDTMKWAMKCSAINRDGVWHDVYKDPVTDPGKTSKKGRLGLFKENEKFVTKRVEEASSENLLVPVFENGEVLNEYTFQEVIQNASM